MASASIFNTMRLAIVSSGDALQRVQLCETLSAHARGVGHATNVQSFTLPWGSPREACFRLSASTRQAWSARRRNESINSAFQVIAPLRVSVSRWITYLT